MKQLDLTLGQHRSVRIEIARLGERKQPLDDVVRVHQFIVAHGPNAGQRAAFAIASFVQIEADEIVHGRLEIGYRWSATAPCAGGADSTSFAAAARTFGDGSSAAACRTTR